MRRNRLIIGGKTMKALALLALLALLPGAVTAGPVTDYKSNLRHYVGYGITPRMTAYDIGISAGIGFGFRRDYMLEPQSTWHATVRMYDPVNGFTQERFALPWGGVGSVQVQNGWQLNIFDVEGYMGRRDADGNLLPIEVKAGLSKTAPGFIGIIPSRVFTLTGREQRYWVSGPPVPALLGIGLVGLLASHRGRYG